MYTFLIKFDEIFLKSERTKSIFLSKLVENIKKVCKDSIIEIDRGRIIVENCSLDILKRIFGVKYVAKALKVEKDEGKLKEVIREILSDKIRENTKFRVTTHRADKSYPKNSLEINREIGEYIIKNFGGRVSLKDYDINLIIEVRKKNFYVYLEDWEVEGPGGLPYGVEGEIIVSFSGGFDSTLASWILAKRGLKILYLVYFSPINKVPKEVYNVYKALNEKWFLDTKILMIKGKEIAREIKEKVRDEYRQVVYKRILYRIMEKIALENGLKYFATGESLGQKSSQTLENLYATEIVLKEVRVIRPLIAFDKSETIKLIRKIGLYEYVSKVREICRFSYKPFTKIKFLNELEEEEKKINLDRILNNLEIEVIE